MQWTDVKYGDEATPEQMNTVAHGVINLEGITNILTETSGNDGKVLGITGDVLTWVEQITGIPVMSGNQGKILTNDGTNASWSNRITSSTTVDEALGVFGEHGQTADIFVVRRWANTTHTNYYNYFKINSAGMIYTEGLTFDGDTIYTSSLSASRGNLRITSSGVKIARSLADSNPVLIIDNVSSASTGNICEFRSVSVTKAYVDKNGNIYSSGFNLQIETSTPPASATSDGLKGSIRWDEDYIYVCTDTNTWKRTSLTTW